jgi:hypothetical protein
MTKVLSRDGPSRYIAQCEHGTVHIVWDNLTIRLRPEDFVSLAERACARMGNSLAQDEDKGFRLKMHAIGIRFPPEILATLRELMSLAVLQMDKPSEKGNEFRALEEASIELPWTLPSFSLN